jgi:hypothetical protein
MTDRDVTRQAWEEARRILCEYQAAGDERNADATVKRLKDVFDSEQVSQTIDRISRRLAFAVIAGDKTIALHPQTGAEVTLGPLPPAGSADQYGLPRATETDGE